MLLVLQVVVGAVQAVGGNGQAVANPGYWNGVPAGTHGGVHPVPDLGYRDRSARDNRPDSRLKIFSGTANPQLAQVSGIFTPKICIASG